jgi:glucose-1-phosphate thymidylyltransferase
MSEAPLSTAVILAGGLGTRMRHAAPGAKLDAHQQRAAAVGLKAMIPDATGRPFLDHLLSALADVGVNRVILVVAPEHDAIRSHYDMHPPRRVRLEYAVQREPLGTAHAVLAAEPLVGTEPFLVQNADNLYPEAALRALVHLGAPGLVAFARDALLAESNIAPERIAAFALMEVDRDGYLTALQEKPGEEATAAAAADAWISMNLWRFDAAIFDACRDVPRSERGEFELPQAVQLAVDRGSRYRVVTLRAGVLDLSSRGDVATVATLLRDREIRP